MRRPIVFVTDYGRDDTYAAALVGSVLRLVPGVQCIEGTQRVEEVTVARTMVVVATVFRGKFA